MAANITNYEDRGPWFQTATGRVFYPHDPKPYEIFLADIARALSMQCRFNGHCEAFYSIAEHSRWVSLKVAPLEELDGLAKVIKGEAEGSIWARGAYRHLAGLGLYGLMHDAAEAYAGDMVTPLKARLPEYKRVEDAIQRCIGVRFGFREFEKGGVTHDAAYPLVKEVDRRMLLTEKRDLRQPGRHGAPAWEEGERLGLKPYEDLKLRGESPKEAETLFLARFQELWNRLHGAEWFDETEPAKVTS